MTEQGGYFSKGRRGQRKAFAGAQARDVTYLANRLAAVSRRIDKLYYYSMCDAGGTEDSGLNELGSGNVDFNLQTCGQKRLAWGRYKAATDR